MAESLLVIRDADTVLSKLPDRIGAQQRFSAG
jgi:hypothetical protein